MVPTRPCAALWAACFLVSAAASVGCAQSVTSSGGGSTSTTTGGAGGATGGTGGMTGGTDGTGGTVPETCTTADDCKALTGQCATGACVEGKCVADPANNFQPCDDKNSCTTNDQCSNGTCSGITKTCGQASICHIAQCNPANGMCEEMPGDDGAQCDDGDPCTYFGSCQNGTCKKGSPIDCSIFNTDCTVGFCDPVAGCKSKPAFDGFACDDGLFCTISETCSNGVCGNGQPMPCAPVGGCFVGTCDELNNTCTSVPGNDGAACDDGSPCTASTTCAAGVCGGGVPANNGAACDDGTACTVGETCNNGTCGGGTGPTVYLSEDFSDNSAGWTLGPEWQIGPATQGMTSGFSFPDPDTDHSATADDGVAGTVIGGDVSLDAHPFEYIESPPFDTSAAQGPVILGYYRWLNTDSDPYMRSRVEVWNGNQWITVWSTGNFMQDFSWTYMQHDITNYKNPAMRVRFGFDVKQMEFSGYSGWNLDDVLVASQACP
ncbi:MAG: hypothetical protein U0441_19625 [Polyangiaceae bacterium]